MATGQAPQPGARLGRGVDRVAIKWAVGLLDQVAYLLEDFGRLVGDALAVLGLKVPRHRSELVRDDPLRGAYPAIGGGDLLRLAHLVLRVAGDAAQRRLVGHPD